MGIVIASVVAWTVAVTSPAIGGETEPAVTFGAGVWFAACVIGSLFYPPSHSTPLEKLNVFTPAVGDTSGAMYATPIMRMTPLRIGYNIVNFLQVQCAAFILGSMLYGIVYIGVSPPSSTVDTAASSTILVAASIVAAIGLFLPTQVSQVILLVQAISIFVPFAFERKSPTEVHVNQEKLIGACIASFLAMVIFGWRSMIYLRTVLLTAACTAGSLVFIATSWANMIDPASSGPYTIIVVNLAWWCTAVITILLLSRPVTIIATGVVAISVSLVITLVDIPVFHGSMYTWVAVLANTAIMIVWLIIYDVFLYQVILAAYLKESMKRDPNYGQTQNGRYLNALYRVLQQPPSLAPDV